MISDGDNRRGSSTVERLKRGVAVIKFEVNRCVNGTGCFEVKVKTDTADFSNMRITRLGQS